MEILKISQLDELPELPKDLVLFQNTHVSLPYIELLKRWFTRVAWVQIQNSDDGLLYVLPEEKKVYVQRDEVIVDPSKIIDWSGDGFSLKPEPEQPKRPFKINPEEIRRLVANQKVNQVVEQEPTLHSPPIELEVKPLKPGSDIPKKSKPTLSPYKEHVEMLVDHSFKKTLRNPYTGKEEMLEFGLVTKLWRVEINSVVWLVLSKRSMDRAFGLILGEWLRINEGRVESNVVFSDPGGIMNYD